MCSTSEQCNCISNLLLNAVILFKSLSTVFERSSWIFCSLAQIILIIILLLVPLIIPHYCQDKMPMRVLHYFGSTPLTTIYADRIVGIKWKVLGVSKLPL